MSNKWCTGTAVCQLDNKTNWHWINGIIGALEIDHLKVILFFSNDSFCWPKFTTQIKSCVSSAAIRKFAIHPSARTHSELIRANQADRGFLISSPETWRRWLSTEETKIIHPNQWDGRHLDEPWSIHTCVGVDVCTDTFWLAMWRPAVSRGNTRITSIHLGFVVN